MLASLALRLAVGVLGYFVGLEICGPMDEIFSYDYLINPMNVALFCVVSNPKQSPQVIIERAKSTLLANRSSRFNYRLVQRFGYMFHKRLTEEERA
mmetsp:Transcript_17498/g.29469  ORF Transcript_17498/g.29469 Transcript_17498/m.29469 type:complete len:96 (+) Transcript_17498:311-598(+)